MQQVEARAGDDLAVVRAADVSDRGRGEYLIVIHRARPAGEIGARRGIPALNHVLKRDVLADQQKVYQLLDRDSSLEDRGGAGTCHIADGGMLCRLNNRAGTETGPSARGTLVGVAHASVAGDNGKVSGKGVVDHLQTRRCRIDIGDDRIHAGLHQWQELRRQRVERDRPAGQESVRIPDEPSVVARIAVVRGPVVLDSIQAARPPRLTGGEVDQSLPDRFFDAAR